jgi:hypothetical protein
MKQIENEIPTEEDWQGYQDDLDARFAYKLFWKKHCRGATCISDERD